MKLTFGHPANEPAPAPGHEMMPVANRECADTVDGSTKKLRWSACSDVGLVRGHNEDSFVAKAPLFCVCDGMGGQAAGEVASAIAVQTIAQEAPEHADDTLLGAAVEAANAKIIESVALGEGQPGMGCTASAVVVEDDKIAIAHVGDSRIYLLRDGRIARETKDHSFVEELVLAGEITPEEARVHPQRSVITRALGNDPEMYADHFTLDAIRGDRIIICSDGLSSMVTDDDIESIAVSCATPKGAAEQLVSQALQEGGHDNVTVIVVDILNDGVAEKRRRALLHLALKMLIVLLAALIVLGGVSYAVVRNSWYLAEDRGYVAIYQGIDGEFLGQPLSEVIERSSVKVSDLEESTQHSLAKEGGISVESLEDGQEAIADYQEQIQKKEQDAEDTASNVQDQADSQELEDGASEAEGQAQTTSDPTESATTSTGESAGDGVVGPETQDSEGN